MSTNTQNVPIASGATVKVSGNSIDGFNATATGTLSIVRPDGVTQTVNITQTGYNSISVPISANMTEPGVGTVTSSSGAAGTLIVGGAPGLALSAAPTTCTVAQLPAPATTDKGVRAVVSDANAAYTTANVGSTVAGGGANTVPVWNNGTNWIIG